MYATVMWTTSTCNLALFIAQLEVVIHHFWLMSPAGEEWHLRKTNWCGEASDLLDDEVCCVCVYVYTPF